MIRRFFNLVLIGFLLFTSCLALAQDRETSAGLTLLEPSGARPAALGQAFTAAINDVTSLAYNPSTLATLSQTQASFTYQQEIEDGNFGQLFFGHPTKSSGLGASVGYYDAGKIDGFDGTTRRSVAAERDVIASLGFAQRYKALSMGISGKYLHSQIAETTSAHAYAGDFGMMFFAPNRFRLGAAVQNIGSDLKYTQESNKLPEIVRAGLSWDKQINTNFGLSVFLDSPYYLEQSEIRPGGGLEANFGPLSLRTGYQGGRDLNRYSFGAGFRTANMSIDYAFGLVDKFDDIHRISMNGYFGSKNEANFDEK